MSLSVRSGVALALAAAALHAAPAAAQMRFAIVGDIGSSRAAAAVAELIKGQRPDHVLTTGDNCYGRIPISVQIGSNYGDFVQRKRFWPTLGNHDYRNRCGDGGRAYAAYFDLPNNERYYDVRLGPVHFFAINSNRFEPDGVTESSLQAEWIRRKLQSSSAPWQIVFFHHPPFSSGEHGSSRFMRWPFERWGVDAVLNGHDHNYERVLRDDNGDGRQVPYFVTGLGGRSRDPIPRNVEGSTFKYNDEFGALFLTATERQLKFEFRNIRGEVVDAYTISR